MSVSEDIVIPSNATLIYSFDPGAASSSTFLLAVLAGLVVWILIGGF